ncbi:hypothetical protein AVEN_89912-1 [Araneus ventricosus]|uniref:Uncharacterized protein n=1 Tax=Araneus ventricosus TaxID=182803 RepID=A0A4Y2UK26_ARAVE|nr:hypothetical protein AVEN_257517-1 [Araneus ventricosus]GBO11900.1 hypothetical protein AVEN_89912-1 [Araneus ventricosus]
MTRNASTWVIRARSEDFLHGELFTALIRERGTDKRAGRKFLRQLPERRLGDPGLPITTVIWPPLYSATCVLSYLLHGKVSSVCLFGAIFSFSTSAGLFTCVCALEIFALDESRPILGCVAQMFFHNCVYILSE